jgi:CRISPR-associated endonuclease Cas2
MVCASLAVLFDLVFFDVVVGVLLIQQPVSVFECEAGSKAIVEVLRGKLRALIDPEEDQIRMYSLGDRPSRSLVVIGARTLEERQDFWIIT